METILTAFNLLLSSIGTSVDCYDSSIRSLFLTRVFQLYFLAYFKSVLEFCINYYCLVGTFDFYLSISSKSSASSKSNNCLSKISYKIICLIIFIFGCILFSFRIFDEEIIFLNQSNLSNFSLGSGYQLEKTSFSEWPLTKWIIMLSFFLRDFVYVIILIILNSMIFYKVRKSIRHKKFIQNININVSNTNEAGEPRKTSSLDTKFKRTNLSLKMMIIIGNLNNLIGRISILLYFILDTTICHYKNITLGEIMFNLIIFCVYFSYLIKFFLYYITNKTFRSILKAYILKILNK
jgi:hypothetical protein